MDEPSVSPHRVTQLLAQWSDGDNAALAELTRLAYEELRRVLIVIRADNASFNAAWFALFTAAALCVSSEVACGAVALCEA